MAANHFFQAIREKVKQAFLMLGDNIPDVDTSGEPSIRSDGVVEFNLRWRVVGDDECGKMAHWSDRDDTLEFGVVERDPDSSATNLLHVTIIFDNDIAQLNVMSERYSDFNYDVTLSTPLESPGRIDEVIELLHSLLNVSE